MGATVILLLVPWQIIYFSFVSREPGGGAEVMVVTVGVEEMVLGNRMKVILVLVILAVICAIGALSGVIYFAEQQPHRGVVMEDLAKMYRPEVKQLGLVVIKTYREYCGNTVRWSAAYFGCLFGSAFFSAMAALLLKFELLGNQPKLRNDLAATLATVAALLVTLSTTGNFQRKWQANRVAAAGMQNLAYELIRPSGSIDVDLILTRIQKINDRRNQGIVGEIGESGSKESSALPVQAQPVSPADASLTVRP